jgi:chloride channel 7
MEFNYVNNPPTSIDELLRLASTVPTYKPKSKESLDYDLFESQVKLLHQSKNVTKTSITECKRWSLTTIVATVTALLAVLITWCTRILLQYKYAVAQQYLTPPIQLSNTTSTTITTTFVKITTTFLILSGINVLFTALAAAVVIFIAPIAAGSGIPEIKCLLNGIKIPHVVRIKTLVAKTVGVILSVAGGLPLGKEGPMIHIGAVIGAGLSQGKSTTCGVDTGFSKLSMFRNDHGKYVEEKTKRKSI